jgi:sugar phosphate isomerase/epimerase
MEELAKRTKILFQIDIFWAFNAGKDPVQVLDQYRDRIRTVHLKDGFPHNLAENTEAVGKSLGQGIAPVAEVRKVAIERGLRMVVESEGLDPTGILEVKRCIDYLKELDAKDGI